jgi:hypothetical protein
MIPEISAALTALITATKAVSGVLNRARDVETKTAISGILDSLLDAQTKLLAFHSKYDELAEINRQLQQKIVEYEKWDAQAERYKLQEIVKGIFVYVLQPDQAKGQPIHWLCPNCFEEHQKSILQKPGVDHLNYKCHRCSFDIIRQFPTIRAIGERVSTFLVRTSFRR